MRVFQEFATLDLISQARAEIVAGRGSFTEAYPLIRLDLNDYDSLFAEKLDLLLKLRADTHVRWSGKGGGADYPALHGHFEMLSREDVVLQSKLDEAELSWPCYAKLLCTRF